MYFFLWLDSFSFHVPKPRFGGAFSFSGDVSALFGYYLKKKPEVREYALFADYYDADCGRVCVKSGAE
ncbi:hypothetical protein [Geovibrio sp. ADMFC3]